MVVIGLEGQVLIMVELVRVRSTLMLLVPPWLKGLRVPSIAPHAAFDTEDYSDSGDSASEYKLCLQHLSSCNMK